MKTPARLKQIALFLTIALASTSATFAQSLRVKNTANLRNSASTSSQILETLKTGDALYQRTDSVSATYFYVQSLVTGQIGWVYKPLVQSKSSTQKNKIEKSGTQTSVATNDLAEVRVFDVGQGLCTLIKLPGGKYVIYDAGSDNLADSARTYKQLTEHINPGTEIELLVISHTDADHLTSAGEIIKNFRVKKVISTGFEKSIMWKNRDPNSKVVPTKAYNRFMAALKLKKDQTTYVDLYQQGTMITPGTTVEIGAAKLIFLCGFPKPQSDWLLEDDAERMNSVSIVMKLVFGKHSVLFCGDAVGRHKSDGEDSLLGTERFLVEKAAQWLPSTIIIAPHHGAKNGSAKRFVELVNPKFVIFSAGHEHGHPAARTAKVYKGYTNKLFRTDLGDDETKKHDDEWNFGRVNLTTDKYGDEDVHIQLFSNKDPRVFYVYKQ